MYIGIIIIGSYKHVYVCNCIIYIYIYLYIIHADIQGWRVMLRADVVIGKLEWFTVLFWLPCEPLKHSKFKDGPN